MLEHRQVDEGRAILVRLEPEYEYDLDADNLILEMMQLFQLDALKVEFHTPLLPSRTPLRSAFALLVSFGIGNPEAVMDAFANPRNDPWGGKRCLWR